MHLLMLTEYFPGLEHPGLWMTGGVEARCYYIAREVSIAHQVTVIAAHVDGLPEEEHCGRLRVLRVGFRRRYTQASSLIGRISYMWSAVRRASSIPVDVIEACSWIAYPPASRIAAKLHVPSVAFCFDVWAGQWCRMFGAAGILGEALERYAWSRRWSLFNVISLSTRRKLLQQGVRADRVKVFAPGIDLQEIDRAEAVKSDHPSVCCVARLVPYKRVQDLIEAVAIVRRRVPRLTCTIIGTGPMEMELRRLATDRGLEAAVTFVSAGLPHSEVYRHMKSATVFCLPSCVEGFGIVVAEALACGTPAICADIEALRGVVGDGAAGLLFEPGNAMALAGCIEQFLGDGALYARCVSSGRALAVAYDYRTIAEATTRTYENLQMVETV